MIGNVTFILSIFQAIILVSYSYPSNNGKTINYGLVKKYLDTNWVTFVSFVSCEYSSSVDDLRILQTFSKNVKTMVLDSKFLHINFRSIFGSIDFKQLIVIETHCDLADQLLENISETRSFHIENWHWLVFVPFGKKDSIIKKFSILNLSINSRVTLAVENHDKIYDIYDVYNPGFSFGGKINITNLGFWVHEWNNSYVDIVNKRKWIYAERVNLSQIKISTAVAITKKIHIDFMSFLQDRNDVHTLSNQKYSFVLLTYLEQLFNFSMKIYRVNSWGYLHQNKFDGMIGHIKSENAELGVTSAFVWKERLQAVDYTSEVWLARSAFIFRNPTSSIKMIFLIPFTNSVWFCLSVFTVLIMCSLRLALSFEAFVRRKNNDYVDKNWSLVIAEVIGAMAQQGFGIIPQLISSRVIIFWVLIFAGFIYQFYSASIVSSLLMAPTVNIKTLGDLLASPLEVGNEDILYHRDYFNKTTDPVSKELYYRKMLKGQDPLAVDSSIFMDAHIGLQKVKEGGYAFHGDTASMYPIIKKTFSEKIICELAEVPLKPRYLQRMGIPIKKRSPYKKIITFGLRRLLETGLIRRLLSIYDHAHPLCGTQNTAVITAVGFDAFSPAFFLLVTGMLAAAILLILEILYMRK